MIIILVMILAFNVIGLLLASKFNFSTRIIKWILITNAMIFALIAFLMEPYWDLVENFKYIKSIDDSGEFFGMLFKPYSKMFTGYQFYIVFNLICFICVKIGNYHLVPCFMVLVDYLIFAYIMTDYTKKNKIKNYNIYIPAILLNMVFVPFYLAINGMRNATAAAIVGLAVYRFYYCNQRIKSTFFIIIIAALIHPLSLCVIPFILVTYYNITIQALVIMLIIVLTSQRLYIIMINSSSEFIKLIGSKMITYSGSDQFVGGMIYLYADLLCLLIILGNFVYRILSNHRKKVFIDNFDKFVTLYVIFIFGNIGNYDLILRPTYFFGFLTPILITKLVQVEFSISHKTQIFLKHLSLIIICIISIIVIMDYVPFMIEHLDAYI